MTHAKPQQHLDLKFKFNGNQNIKPTGTISIIRNCGKQKNGYLVKVPDAGFF